MPEWTVTWHVPVTFTTKCSIRTGQYSQAHILVLTAKGQKMRDLFEMAPNVAAYVQKPFDPKTLRELITGILTNKK